MDDDQIADILEEVVGEDIWKDLPVPRWLEIKRFAFLVAEREREECAGRASIALLGALQTTTDRVLKAIKGGQE